LIIKDQWSLTVMGMRPQSATVSVTHNVCTMYPSFTEYDVPRCTNIVIFFKKQKVDMRAASKTIIKGSCTSNTSSARFL